VALAIDRDHGGVLVATKNPDSVILRGPDVAGFLTWTVKLSGAPVAVAALASTIVVSSGTTLWKSRRQDRVRPPREGIARPWRR
jgi:hypothetical protein